MIVRSSDLHTTTVLLGVRCPFHPLTPLGQSIIDIRNIENESNIITMPTICVFSTVKIGSASIFIHSHLRDFSYCSDEEGMEVPVSRFSDARLNDEGILFRAF